MSLQHLRRVLALFSVAALALAVPSMAQAASDTGSTRAPQVMAGKVPACNNAGAGGGSVLLSGPLVTGAGPGSGPDQQVRNGTFLDAMGSEYIWVSVDGVQPCPGLPSDVKILSPVETTGCGSVELLTIEVTDQGGYNVADGTIVSLSTNLGSVPESVTTKDGLATASFLASSGIQGRAEITVRAGGVFAQKTISITCATSVL